MNNRKLAMYINVFCTYANRILRELIWIRYCPTIYNKELCVLSFMRSKDTDNTIYMNIIDNVARLWLRLTNLFDTFCYTDRIFYNIIVRENRILPKLSQKLLY